MLYDRETFFNIIRQAPFAGSLKQSQVDGMERLLSTWEKYYADKPLQHHAYCMATSFHETAQKMQPVKEYGGKAYYTDMYDITGSRPEKAKELGNTEPGDGAKYCGRGDVQLTGKTNYRTSTHQINLNFDLGVDLVNQPDKALDPFVSAHNLYLGCIEGWYTGKKLGDYTTYKGMRYVVNGQDKAQTIATYADNFEAALEAAYDVQAAKQAADVAWQDKSAAEKKADKMEAVVEEESHFDKLRSTSFWSTVWSGVGGYLTGVGSAFKEFGGWFGGLEMPVQITMILVFAGLALVVFSLVKQYLDRQRKAKAAQEALE